MTSRTDPIYNLMTLISSDMGTPIDDKRLISVVKDWLIPALWDWFCQKPSERAQIEFYLDLSAGEAGDDSVVTKLQTEIRNYYIREAIREIQQKLNMKPWPAAGYLSKKIIRLKPFAGKRQPTDSVEYYIFQATTLNMYIPKSQQRIFDISKIPPTIDFGFLAQK
jgi:hypothetical protein